MYVSFCRSCGQIYAPDHWCAFLKMPQANINKFDLLFVIKNGSCRRNVYLLHTSIFTFPSSPSVYHLTKDSVTFPGNFRCYLCLQVPCNEKQGIQMLVNGSSGNKKHVRRSTNWITIAAKSDCTSSLQNLMFHPITHVNQRVKQCMIWAFEPCLGRLFIH